MALGTEWATIDDVKKLLADPYPDDVDITASIVDATSALEAAFCVVPLDVDPEDTYPDDWSVRRACAILSAQLLTANPMAGSVAGEAIESESIGGYSYRSRSASRTQATALRIDGVVLELVGGYLCQPGVYDLETLVDRHFTVEVADVV